jgi:vitamin K-dependent gamma-carboxylase
VSLNGRRLAPLIDPSVDLARVSDGLAKAPWILPAPEGPPPAIRPI